MKLLLVLTEFPPRIGGMQTHALRLATALWARGHDVVVQTYRACTRIEQREGPRVDAALGFPVYRDLSRLSHERNLQLIADRVVILPLPGYLTCENMEQKCPEGPRVGFSAALQ